MTPPSPAPEAAARRFPLAIAAIVRNEARYLAEWIEYHTLLGAGHFYIFDNGSTDRTADVLDPYIRQGRATLIAWPHHPGQESAYNFAIKCFGHDVRWLALLDIDEFVMLDSGCDLVGFLDDLPDADQILIPWQVFGSSGHDDQPDGLVTENFVHRAATISPEVKCIVRPEAVLWAGTHHCLTHRARTVDCAGQRVAERWISNGRPAGPIRINHYFTKSRAEFAQKIARGQADGGHGKRVEDFDRYDCRVPDDSMRRFSPAIRAALAETASRPRHTSVYAPWSAYSDLAPCRRWHLGARAGIEAALAALSQQGMGAEASIAVDHAGIDGPMAGDVAEMAFRSLLEAMQDHLRVPWMIEASGPFDTAFDIAEVPFGQCFVAWLHVGVPASIALVVEGVDAGDRPHRHARTLPAATIGTAVLSPRTIHAQRLTASAGEHGLRIAVASLI